MLPNLSIGVEDWQRSELINSYYPEGMPEDWRYEFYFNDFRTALVSQDEWLDWSVEETDELLNSRRDESALYLKIDDWQPAFQTRLEQLKMKLGDLIAGFLVFDDQMDALMMSSLCAKVTRVSQQQVLSGWQWVCQGWIISGTPCGWLAELPSDMKQQRIILQDFVTSLPDKNTGYAFFVGGESIKMSKVQDLQTLAELLGL
jgi:hypothetical protein